MLQTEVVEKIKIHVLYSITFFFYFRNPSTKTELARGHRKDARYENGKGNILLETHLKKANRKTKDTLAG